MSTTVKVLLTIGLGVTLTLGQFFMTVWLGHGFGKPHQAETAKNMGPDGAWLSPDYVNGIDQVELDGMLVAADLETGIVVLQMEGLETLETDLEADTVASVIGVNYNTGATAWELEAADCLRVHGLGPLVDGDLYCLKYPHDSEENEIVRINPSTGDMVKITSYLPSQYSTLEEYAEVLESGVAGLGVHYSANGTLILVYENTLNMFQDGSSTPIVMEENFRQSDNTCHVVADRLACLNRPGLTDSPALTTYSLDDGTRLTHDDQPCTGEFERFQLLADGYTCGHLGISMESLDYPVYDFDGNQTGTTQSTIPPVAPNDLSEVFYYAEALGTSTQAADQQGNAVVEYRSPESLTFSQTGATYETGEHGGATYVASDGSATLMTGGLILDTTATLTDNEANVIHTEELTGERTISMTDGLLYVIEENGVTLWIPRSS